MKNNNNVVKLNDAEMEKVIGGYRQTNLNRYGKSGYSTSKHRGRLESFSKRKGWLDS